MAEPKPNSRPEAFCDVVFAIALTLLIIDIKLPHSIAINNTADFWHALRHILAIWFPLVIAIVTILTWIFWLIWGISIKHE